MYKNYSQWEALRSAATAAIGTNYATIGSGSAGPIIAAIFKNATNGDVVVSTDGSTDMLMIPANSYDAWDIQTNHMSFPTTEGALPKNTQFWVKDGSTIPTSGTFYIEVMIVNQVVY